MLWKQWWKLVCELQAACARTRTFLWMAVCLAGMTVRGDLMGVTSIVLALGLLPACYYSEHHVLNIITDVRATCLALQRNVACGLACKSRIDKRLRAARPFPERIAGFER